jgi:phage terminase large subunit-like protein
MALGKVYFPRNAPWVQTLVAQMLAFPAGKHDDGVDVLSLFGRLLDQMFPSTVTPEKQEVVTEPHWMNA